MKYLLHEKYRKVLRIITRRSARYYKIRLETWLKRFKNCKSLETNQLHRETITKQVEINLKTLHVYSIFQIAKKNVYSD